ncbi:MAG TPA: DUF1512 domain-containing protein [Thermoprotei archaeon]|nr:DUF1512 domain-containing protein [Thermoprotei archaeon]
MIDMTLQIIDDFNIIIQTLYILLFIVLIFFGQRIQFHLSLMEVGGVLRHLAFLKDTAIKMTIDELKKYSTDKDLNKRFERLLNSFMIMPEAADPSGIVKKIEHIVNIREARFLDDLKRLITSEIEESKVRNLSNMVEATMALNIIYKIIQHYYLLAKKTKNFFIMAQLQMIVPLIFNEAKSYLQALNAFKLGTPIGDSIGPLIVHKFIQHSDTKTIEYKKEYVKDTDVYVVERNGRIFYVIKASGPGGNVGKPGEAIKKVINSLKKKNEKIAGIIMIDAALKLEGEKTGEVAEGVGAAIGGIGVEKFKIEEIATKNKVPLYAIIIKQSLMEAITTIKKEIADTISDAINRVDRISNEELPEGNIILAGIGNTIGVP